MIVDHKWFAIKQPLATHWRLMTCEEVGCPNWRHGWVTRVNPATKLGALQAQWIRANSGRRFTERPTPVGVEFVFPAGQTCFNADSHYGLRGDREPFYVIRDGINNNPVTVSSAISFVDEMATHTQRLVEFRERLKG